MFKQNTVLLVVIVILLLVIIALAVLVFQKQREIVRLGLMEKVFGEISSKETNWQNPDDSISSRPLEEKDIPNEAIKIGVSAKGFSPASFEVKRGEKVILVLTSQDEWSHSLRFRHGSLDKAAIGVNPNETRGISFYTPKEPGEYEFFCGLYGHEGRGERGVMIVK